MARSAGRPSVVGPRSWWGRRARAACSQRAVGAVRDPRVQAVDLQDCDLLPRSTYAVLVYISGGGGYPDGAVMQAEFSTWPSNRVLGAGPVVSGVSEDGASVGFVAADNGTAWALVVREVDAARLSLTTVKSSQDLRARHSAGLPPFVQ